MSQKIDKVNLNSPESQELLKDFKVPQGFDRVGFTRPLGGFFYDFFFALIGGVIIALTFSQILAVLYPYPDAKAYNSVGSVLFSFLFMILNIPTSFALEIFIAEWRVKNPLKMVQYIRFYCWFQMITGVILVTTTSIYVLYILNSGNLMYAKWLMLVLISREYPAMTGVFDSALKGMQQFDKDSKLRFIKGTFIEPIFEILCVLWGRFVLGSNPMFGELLGIAIGYAIGTYIDDFISMLLAARYLRQVIKKIGFTISDLFIPSINKDVWQNSLRFGIALSPPSILSSLLGFFTFFWWYDLVPAYATLLVLSGTADQLANLIKRGGGVYMKSTFSESLNNGKKKLSEFYIAMTFKFTFLSMVAVGIILYSFLPIILELMFVAAGIENWLLAIAFITPNIIATVLEQPIATANDVILGSNHPWWHTFTSIFSTLFDFIVDIILLFVLKWPQNMGITFLIWLIPLKSFPRNVILIIIDYVYIQYKIVQVHYHHYIWQWWVAPVLAGSGVYIIAQGWFQYLYEPLLMSTGIYVTGGITIVIAFLCLLWVFFPLYCFFGGWDDYGIKVFSAAVDISGPSRILFKPIVYVNKLMIKSKLHNKFPIPWEEADREADELMKERFIRDKRMQQEHVLTQSQ